MVVALFGGSLEQQGRPQLERGGVQLVTGALGDHANRGGESARFAAGGRREPALHDGFVGQDVTGRDAEQEL